MSDVRMLLQKAEMIQHRMIGREIKLADHAHRIMPGLDAGELDAGLRVKQLAAGQLGEEIEMPPGAAELAVGRKLEADRGLLVHDLLDFQVLDLAQIIRRDLALLPLGARLLDLLRPEQAADLVGVEGGPCSLHVLTPAISMFSGTSHTQMALQHRGIGLQRLARRIVHDAAALQYNNAVGEPQDLLRVLLDNDGADSRAAGNGPDRLQ